MLIPKEKGCTYAWKESERGEEILRECRKVKQLGSDYCPHHSALINCKQQVDDAKMAKARAGKERKKAMREALKESPLAAYNSAYDQKRRVNYTEPK